MVILRLRIIMRTIMRMTAAVIVGGYDHHSTAVISINRIEKPLASTQW